MAHGHETVHRHGNGQPGRHAHGHSEEVVRVGIHVDHHRLGGRRVVQRDDQHDEVQQVVEQLQGVRHAQREQVNVGGGGHVPVAEHDQGQRVACNNRMTSLIYYNVREI